jgi:hypothetical protein
MSPSILKRAVLLLGAPILFGALSLAGCGGSPGSEGDGRTPVDSDVNTGGGQGRPGAVRAPDGVGAGGFDWGWSVGTAYSKFQNEGNDPQPSPWTQGGGDPNDPQPSPWTGQAGANTQRDPKSKHHGDTRAGQF